MNITETSNKNKNNGIIHVHDQIVAKANARSPDFSTKCFLLKFLEAQLIRYFQELFTTQNERI